MSSSNFFTKTLCSVFFAAAFCLLRLKDACNRNQSNSVIDTWSAEDIYVNKLSASLAMKTPSKRTNPKTNFYDLKT